MLHIAGSPRIPLAKPLLDQAKPSTTALHRGQSDTAEGHTPTKDAICTSMDVDKKAEMLPKESKQQSDTLQEAEQPHAAPAQQAATSSSQLAVETHEPLSNFASHPTAVESVRHFVKSQVRWLLNSIRQSFISSNKNGAPPSQPEQQTQQKESK